MVVSKNGYLNTAERTENAEYILGYLLSKGWTRNAICGMLGNMESESTINPGIWESLTPFWRGYGLVQWTPYTKFKDWADQRSLDYTDINAQLMRIEYEVENNLQWFGGYSSTMTFAQFTHSTASPEYLANVFIKTYEHPANSNQPIRGTQARYWWDNLSDSGGVIDPIDPTDPPDPDPEPEPETPIEQKSIIQMLLSDTLNGWKH